MNTPSSITLVEVGPRDGLQNEAVELSLSQKVELIHRLTSAGVQALEFGSFSNPKKVPQMAGSGDLFKTIVPSPKVVYFALIPNEKGYHLAKYAGVQDVRLVVVASEALHKANFGRSIDESLCEHSRIIALAKTDKTGLEVVIGGSFGDPFTGLVSIDSVLNVVNHYQNLGIDRITVADTVGMGTPKHVHDLISALHKHYPDIKIGVHFHDTRGTGMANSLTALQLGITQFDASIGGLGGCPFAPKAGGNLASEDLLHMLAGMGIETNIDLDIMIDTGRWLEGILGRNLPSKLMKAEPVYWSRKENHGTRKKGS